MRNVFSLSAFQSLLNSMFYLVRLLTGAPFRSAQAAKALHPKSHLLFICNEQNAFQIPTARLPSALMGSNLQHHPGPLMGRRWPGTSVAQRLQTGVDKRGRAAEKQCSGQQFWVQTSTPPLPGYETSGQLLILTEPHFLIEELTTRSLPTSGSLILILSKGRSRFAHDDSFQNQLLHLSTHVHSHDIHSQGPKGGNNPNVP